MLLYIIILRHFAFFYLSELSRIQTIHCMLMKIRQDTLWYSREGINRAGVVPQLLWKVRVKFSLIYDASEGRSVSLKSGLRIFEDGIAVILWNMSTLINEEKTVESEGNQGGNQIRDTVVVWHQKLNWNANSLQWIYTSKLEESKGWLNIRWCYDR